MKNMRSLGLFLMAWCVFALPAMACAEHEAAAMKTAALVKEGEAVAPANKVAVPVSPDFAAYEPSESCKGIAYYDFGSALDGAAYYVAEATGKVVAECGGSCRGRGEECQKTCPPEGWTCGLPKPTPAVKK